ncbi:hypothetical protein [Aeropyrum globular virus 1]|uniref:hypothetical protein n=1 Tax=Aeropyrum globular virus 1 TaxID=1932713 RepID=UPI000C7F2F1B|nr:hypothetical protein C1186_gp10 [Aeropyrum globular virus 1]BBC20936.1 hypothetical protein [Aeropyrum globular virus 1]
MWYQYGTGQGGPGTRWYLAVLPLAVLLDATTTTIGLWLGLAENGPLASMLLPVLGPLYWLLELTVILILYNVIRRYARLPSDWAMLVSVIGPWTAGWANLAMVARVVLGG